MKKTRDNLKNQNKKGRTQSNKALVSSENNSYLNSDSQSNFNSNSKKKCDEKAVILGINASSNKCSSKDGTFKVHHYRKDYDPDKIIETSQIIIKKKDQLIALDKYVFGGDPNSKQNKVHEKKVNIIGINPENQQPSKITSGHRRRIRNSNPKPGQITATAVLIPDGLYHKISSTDGEYVTIDSSAPNESVDSNSNIVQKQSKVKLESSFESSDIFRKKLSPTKSVQAEIESSFVDSGIGISPRNPHGLWKNNMPNEMIEVEYEYVTVDEEEEEENENKNESEKNVVKEKEVSINNGNNEEIVEYEIIEEEEEEEENEFEMANKTQKAEMEIEEEEEYEYVFEEDENENNLVPSNSLGDVQPLNVFQKKQVQIIPSNENNPKIRNSEYDEENDYATEENVNTQSFINSERAKTRNDQQNEEEEEEEGAETQGQDTEQINSQNEIKMQSEGIENSEHNEEIVKDNSINNDENDQPLQQENNALESNNSQNSQKNQVKLSSINTTAESVIKLNQNPEESSNKECDNELNLPNKSEKKAKFVNDGANISESINVNDIQSSTTNQFDQKSEPTVSVFEEYVFADENEKEKEQKANIVIADASQNLSKMNDSSFSLNNSTIQERNAKQISNTLNNLVKNKNQIMKSEIESTEININVVDDFSQNKQNNNPSNLSSPSKVIKRLYLSPSNAVESKSRVNENKASKNEAVPSNDEKDKNQTKSKIQFDFENNASSINQQINNQSDDETNKANEDDRTLATCDLNMSNIQRSPPAKENKRQAINNSKTNDGNSDEYYSHEYYTTMETNEISNRNRSNKSPNSKKNDSRNSRRNRNNSNDSYYSYSYYSDAYTYSYDPSTIDTRQSKSKHHHRRHNNEYTYEYVTNGTYETMDRRGVRPINDRSNQLPIELQQQIQQQLQNQIQLNSTSQSNQSTPYSIRLRVKDGQKKLFDLDNGKSPKFILRTVSEDGKATPHNIELVLESVPVSSTQTPVHSNATSASQSAQVSVPNSPTISKEKNGQAVKFEMPQIVQSGPHKGLIKRRIKKSEKAKHETEKHLLQVEQQIKKMEQMILEQDEEKKKQQAASNGSIEITTSTIGPDDSKNSPFSKSPSRKAGRGRKQTNRGGNPAQGQSRNAPSTTSKTSRPISSSSTNSPNKKHYYDENGNPVLVEVSDPTGRPVFRRIASRSSASSSIKHGASNPIFKNVTQSLPRPVRSRNAELNVDQEKQQLFGTPKRSMKKLITNNEIDDNDKNSLKKSPSVKVNHQIHLNDDNLDSDSDIDSDDEENFVDFNNKNVENQMEFGKVYRSRKAPHINKAKYQNRQIYLKPRNGNKSGGPSAGSTPLKKAVFDSDSDSDFDEDDQQLEMKNMSPDSKRRKREELTKEIEQLRQMLPDQAANSNNKDEYDKYSSNKQVSRKPPSIPSNQRKQPKRFVNEDEYDPFEDFDENFDNLQRSPYDPSQNINNKNNNNNRLNMNRPTLQLNPVGNRNPSDGSASSLTERRKMPKITVEIPSKGNEGQADVFRRHYENASPEKVPRKTPDRYRDFNEYDEDDSVPLNASTKNTSKNLDEENQGNKDENGINHQSSNFSSSKKLVRKRIRVSMHDGSRSPAPHSSNPLKDSEEQQQQQQQYNSKASNSKSSNSKANTPSKKQRETVKPLIDTFKANLMQKLNSLDDDDYDDDNNGNQASRNLKNDDQDSMEIAAMNPVQAMKHEKKMNQNDVAPFTPPADADLNQSSSMLSNAPPPSPKNQDVEIVVRNGKRKRKKKISLSPGTHSHSSRNSGTRGNVIRSHHLKDSEKYPQDSPPPSVLSSVVEDDIDE